MPIIKGTRYVLKRIEQFLIYRVISLNDTPHRLALGVAIGIFVTWTPTIGLQMILTLLLAMLFKANKIVGIPFVWISNPFTIIPIYGPNYWVGCKIIGSDAGDAWQNLISASSVDGWWNKVCSWFEAITPIFWELWLGSLVIAVVLGFLTYIGLYRLIIVYRRKLELHHSTPVDKNGKTSDPSQGSDKSDESHTNNTNNHAPETKDTAGAGNDTKAPGTTNTVDLSDQK